MISSAINWISWACVFFALVFIGMAYAAISGGNPEGFAVSATAWTAYLIFFLCVVLIGCILYDQSVADEDEEDDEVAQADDAATAEVDDEEADEDEEE